LTIIRDITPHHGSCKGCWRTDQLLARRTTKAGREYDICQDCANVDIDNTLWGSGYTIPVEETFQAVAMFLGYLSPQEWLADVTSPDEK